MHAARLCRKCGMMPTANTKPGKHLPPEHPQMQKVRSWLQAQIHSGRCHGQLLCNFDQVWTLMFRPAKSLLNQRDSVDELSSSCSLKRLRHCLERCLDLPFTDEVEVQREVHRPRIQGGPGASGSVEQWRAPHTLTTVSWADGTMTRGFVTIKREYLSESQRELINKDFVFFHMFQSFSHIAYLYT